MKYPITTKEKFNYIGLVLLNEIINFQHYFDLDPKGDDLFLKPYLEFMQNNGWLEVKTEGKLLWRKNSYYIPTEKGREVLVNLYSKYQEYLKIFDIYCAVDLESGEFAFSNINDDNFSDETWAKYLSEDRFSDVRVAVAVFKGLNPTEIVFMSFLNENRFDCTIEGWQSALTSDDIWGEIEEICDTAVDVEYLKQDGVLEDVIKQGTEIAMQLIKDAEDSLLQDTDEEETIITETTEVEEYVDVVEMPVYGYSYYDPYYDPYYVSPLWLVPAILLF